MMGGWLTRVMVVSDRGVTMSLYGDCFRFFAGEG